MSGFSEASNGGSAVPYNAERNAASLKMAALTAFCPSDKAVSLMTSRDISPTVLFPPPHIMRIGFPSATRCPVCIFGLVLDQPCCKGRPKHRGRLFYFKSQRNRSKLVDCLHIPLAMPAMFQSKRKPAEEMLSQGALSCFHAIRVPLLSQSQA